MGISHQREDTFTFPKASLQLNLLLFLTERVHSSCSEKRERGGGGENQGEEETSPHFTEWKPSLVLKSSGFFSVLMGKKRNEKLTFQIRVTGKYAWCLSRDGGGDYVVDIKWWWWWLWWWWWWSKWQSPLLLW